MEVYNQLMDVLSASPFLTCLLYTVQKKAIKNKSLNMYYILITGKILAHYLKFIWKIDLI